MKKVMLASAGTAAALVMLCGAPALSANAETPQNGWYEENGCKYWYENGVRQGPEGRGKEIYDPDSDAWYWLDAVDGGKMAAGKDVYQESNGGKWVRYDKNGKMVKGWDSNENGTYYFDLNTGAMLKGEAVIDNVHCVFDVNTGVGLNCQWYEVNGVKYWYENGSRQGLEGRGKEIFDPASNAWYWLDAVDGGKMAVSKDVYQESNGGKWVRYDENGHMIKGENQKDGAWYRFDDITGAMIKGWYSVFDAKGAESIYYYDETTGKKVYGNVVINNKECAFDATTGKAFDCQWCTINGGKYWYERGIRQGTEGRGKEIYDPATKAWYWLDAVDKGKMAVSKDVYQESDGGKWVRYDANGRMIKGWSTSNNKKYYFDLTTGAMAKGIVRIDGTDYYFDESTGVYQGMYEGGEVSYSWVNTKATRYDAGGSMTGYSSYEYTDSGALERERTYNGDKRLMTEEKYSYDDSGRLVTYSFRNYTNSGANYTITTTYSNNLKAQEVKKDKNGATIEVRQYVYTNGKLSRMNVYDASENLQYYYIYTVDAKGNITKEQRCSISGLVTQTTTNTYQEYGGQSFLRQSLVYSSDMKVLSGVSYTRNGYELTKEVLYGANREVTEYTEYKESLFPDVEEETTFEKESKTYDAKDNLKFKTIYEYEVMEIRQ